MGEVKGTNGGNERRFMRGNILGFINDAGRVTAVVLEIHPESEYEEQFLRLAYAHGVWKPGGIIQAGDDESRTTVTVTLAADINYNRTEGGPAVFGTKLLPKAEL